MPLVGNRLAGQVPDQTADQFKETADTIAVLAASSITPIHSGACEMEEQIGFTAGQEDFTVS